MQSDIVTPFRLKVVNSIVNRETEKSGFWGVAHFSEFPLLTGLISQKFIIFKNSINQLEKR